MKNKKPTRRAALLLTLFILAGALFTAPASTALESGARYIVKIKNTAVFRRTDRGVPFETVSETEMIRLHDAGLLEWYEPDEVTLLSDGQSDPYYYADEKWDLAMICADAAFAADTVGQGVRVGVVDSGINPHPALKDCLLPGGCYIDGADADDTSDRYGHGTQVAGLIAGADENGCIGAAPGAKLVPLKITDGKTLTVSAVCRAIYGGIDDFGCGVLNLSLGIRTKSQALLEAVEYAEQKGVVIVSAVGNNGNSGLFYPALYETVIGVGAVDETGAVYYHSNQNESVFLTAPGSNVKTAGRGGGYTTVSGTSFAVPHVTAAVAVLRGVDPDLTPKAVRELLSETATDKGDPGWDKAYGWGVVNIGESVRALPGKTPDPDVCDRGDDCPMTRFADLDKTKWYHDGVHWALDNGAAVGTGANAFSPDNAATRAMAVAMLWRLEGSPEPEMAGETAFTDVKAGKWYEKAVLWAAENGLTAGTGAAAFSPDAELTREQLAVFLCRYAEYKGDDVSAAADLSRFTDADAVSGYARSAVKWAVSAGIISGTSKTTVSPKKPATRAETATMLMRCFARSALRPR